jgi:imidazoleglycerol-phosphate dehydratase
MPKTVTVKRKTSETDIEISLGLYGKGKYDVKTGISFLDHMLALFAKHGLFDLKINASGDLDVDIHHTNEDVAITLGEAFLKALGKKAGIKRFGEATVPMDEALVRVAIDISGRPFLKFNADKIKAKDISEYSLNYAEQFLRSFSTNLGVTLHVDVLEGKDQHHILEGIFKALAKAIFKAVEKEPRCASVPSTKGRI